MRRLLVVLSTCVGLLAATPALSALAGVTQTRTPPTIRVVYRHDVIQRAQPYTTCWSYSSGNTGTGYCADGFPDYGRPAAAVHSPARVIIRIPYPSRPKHWHVSAASKLQTRGGWTQPVNSRPLPFRIVPHHARGEITAWDVILRLDQPDRDYYIDTGGYLRQGDAWYALHLRT